MNLIIIGAAIFLIFMVKKRRNGRLSKRYFTWRDKVLKKASNSCVLCGRKSDLQAHHRKSWKIYPTLRYRVSNGVCLCVWCHAKIHPKNGKLLLRTHRKKLKKKS